MHHLEPEVSVIESKQVGRDLSKTCLGEARAIALSNDTLLIQAVGSAGSLTVTDKTGSYIIPVKGFDTITLQLNVTTTQTITSTTTATTTQTTTSTTTKACATCLPTWAYAAMVVLLIVGLAVGYIVKGPSVSKT